MLHIQSLQQNMLELDQSTKTRGHIMKLYCKQANTRPQTNFFPSWVVGLWNSLSEGTALAPSLEAFMGAADKDWSSKQFKVIIRLVSSLLLPIGILTKQHYTLIFIFFVSGFSFKNEIPIIWAEFFLMLMFFTYIYIYKFRDCICRSWKPHKLGLSKVLKLKNLLVLHLSRRSVLQGFAFIT